MYTTSIVFKWDQKEKLFHIPRQEVIMYILATTHEECAEECSKSVQRGRVFKVTVSDDDNFPGLVKVASHTTTGWYKQVGRL